jgi:hypothetical protein
MPIGGGILPASGSNQFNELTYVTSSCLYPEVGCSNLQLDAPHGGADC